MNPSHAPFLDLPLKKKVKRIFVAFVGATVLALGFALVVLPGPAILVIPAGLAILAVEFAWAERWLCRAKAFVKRALELIPSNHGDTTNEPMKEANPIAGRRPQSEEVIQVPDGKLIVSRNRADGRLIAPIAVTQAVVDDEDLSRFEGEGGRAAPIPDRVEPPISPFGEQTETSLAILQLHT